MYLADEHLGAALEEEGAAAPLVDAVDGDEGGADVDDAGDDGGHEGGVVAEADGVEEDGGVEHDDVDAGELLEEGDHDGHGQLGPVLALEERPPGVLDLVRGLARRHEVVELLVHVRHAPHALQLLARLVVHPALDHRVRGVGEYERARHDDQGRHHRAAQAQPPAPTAVDLREEVVEHVGHENSDRDRQLEAYVERSSVLVRRHLG